MLNGQVGHSVCCCLLAGYVTLSQSILLATHLSSFSGEGSTAGMPLNTEMIGPVPIASADTRQERVGVNNIPARVI